MRFRNSQIGEECKRRNELRDYERVFLLMRSYYLEMV